MDRKRHLLTLAGLLGLACLVQTVEIGRATAVGLDTVRFVEMAQRIEAEGFWPTARQEREPAIFPAWVGCIHQILGALMGENRRSWALAAQVAAAIPLVLAVVPVYLLSARLVPSASAVAGGVFFCVLPDVARLGADGIADSTHLLLISMAIWGVVLYLSRRHGGSAPLCEAANSGRHGGQHGGQPGELQGGQHGGFERTGWPGWMLLAGVFGGAALLVRVEAAATLVVGVGITLVVYAGLPRLGMNGRWRRRSARVVKGLGCLTLGAGLAVGPYLVAMECARPTRAVARILGCCQPDAARPVGTTVAPALNASRALGPSLVADRPDIPIERIDVAIEKRDGEAMSFSPKDPTTTLRRRGFPAAAGLFLEELAGAFGYGVGALALVGLWSMRLERRLVDRFARTYVLLFAAGVILFSANEGYLSGRHLLPLVVVGIGCAGHGALDLGRRLAFRGRRHSGARSLAWIVVLVAVGVCLAQRFEPLHASRRGHREAAEWLAEGAEAPGIVLDTRGWTALYSGRTTVRYDDNALAAFARPDLAYVVVERREMEYESARARTLGRLLNAAADPVAVFPGSHRAGSRAEPVVVFRWDAERFARWVSAACRELPTDEDRSAEMNRLLAPGEMLVPLCASVSREIGPAPDSVNERAGPGIARGGPGRAGRDLRSPR